MKLADATVVTEAASRAIAERHGIRGTAFVQMPSSGMTNTVFLLGDDVVLRVPRAHESHVAQLRREAIAIPAARKTGVRTPALIAVDEACDLLPVPYLLVERVHGNPLEHVRSDPTDAPAAWSELGRELAKLHLGVAEDDAPIGPWWPPEEIDPRPLVEERVDDGWLSPLDGEWLRSWLDRLAPLVARPRTRRFLHGDTQATNILVDEGARYEALIDWGCAHWGDPADDFLGVPMRAAPYVLKGLRDVATPDCDETIEARILWLRIWLILEVLPRGAAPGTSWGERPVAWLIDLLRFFGEPVDERWRTVAPSPRVGSPA